MKYVDYYYGILEQITSGTDSSLILFFVIVAGLVLPLYGLLLKDRKHTRQHENSKHDRYIEREREIINVMREISAVIAENTSMTASLKSILEGHGADIKQAIGRVHERIDIVVADTNETKATTKAILSTINRGGSSDNTNN